jgi:hypothetical protein
VGDDGWCSELSFTHGACRFPLQIERACVMWLVIIGGLGTYTPNAICNICSQERCEKQCLSFARIYLHVARSLLIAMHYVDDDQLDGENINKAPRKASKRPMSVSICIHMLYKSAHVVAFPPTHSSNAHTRQPLRRCPKTICLPACMAQYCTLKLPVLVDRLDGPIELFS